MPEFTCRRFGVAVAIALASSASTAAIAQHAADKLDRTALPLQEPARPVYSEVDVSKVKAPPRFQVKAPEGAPNVVIVLVDDMGFGVPSTFGGPVPMPTLDGLAQQGLRYNNFHTTALCSPTRAALKSGRNHHTVNMGFITEMATSMPGSTGQIPNATAPLAEMLRLNGYATAAFGKWHETPAWETSVAGPSTAGRRTRASTSSTVSSVVKPTSGRHTLRRLCTGRVAGRPELPLHDRHDRQGGGVDQVPEGPHARQASVRLFRAGCHPRATPRAERMDREVAGQVRHGLGHPARTDAGRQIRLGVVPAGTKLAPKPSAIKDGETPSADEKRLFTRQAEVFAAYADYTDHEIGVDAQAFAQCRRSR